MAKSPGQLERDIAEFYGELTSARHVAEVVDRLRRADAELAASRARGGGFAGASGDYDPAIYEEANWAAGLRGEMKRAAVRRAVLRSTYTRLARRPTAKNLARRVTTLHNLVSATRGDERARYASDLAVAKRELDEITGAARSTGRT